MSAKKKILAVTSYAAVAALAVGGTIAYFTATDEAVNVMTLGAGVDIELQEQQRSEDGSELVDFVQGGNLLPAVGSAQGAKDNWGMSADIENYVDKIVTVKNTGNNDVYARVIVAVPSAFDDTTSAGNNVLHWNYGNNFNSEGTGALGLSNTEYKAEVNWASAGTAAIEGVDYNLYTFTYVDALEEGETSLAAMVGFYLDSKVDYDAELGKYMINGEVIDYDQDEVYIPVYAQAIQAQGFKTAEEAFAASGFPTNPWENGIELPSVADSAEDLTASLTAGDDNIVISGEVNAEESLAFCGDAEQTADFEWNTGGTMQGGEITLDTGSKYGLIVVAEDNYPADGAAAAATLKNTVVTGAAGAAVYAQAISQDITLDGVTIDNTQGSGLTAEFSGATTTLKDCTITGGNTSEKYWLHNAVGAGLGAKVVIESGTYTGKNAVYVYSSGADVTINGGIFNGAITADAGTITINGGTFSVNPQGIANVTVNGTVVDNGNGTWTVQ